MIMASLGNDRSVSVWVAGTKKRRFCFFVKERFYFFKNFFVALLSIDRRYWRSAVDAVLVFRCS